MGQGLEVRKRGWFQAKEAVWSKEVTHQEQCCQSVLRKKDEGAGCRGPTVQDV